ncbi:MAG: peptidoglycan DD-metalloendopeptidase family protein [Clostridiaceae bacterium]
MKKSSILSLLTAITMSVSILSPSLAFADEKQDLKDQIQQNDTIKDTLDGEKDVLVGEQDFLKTELLGIMTDIEEVQGKLDSVAASIAQKNTEIAEKESEIEATSNEIGKTEEAIGVKVSEIAQKQKEFDEKHEILGDRVRESYKSNVVTKSIGVLLKATSISDFFTKMKVLQNVIKSDNKVMADIEAIRVGLEDVKKELESDKVKLEALKSKQEVEKVALNDKKAELKVEESNLQYAQDDLNALYNVRNEKMDELNSKVAELDSKIGKVEAENSELDAKLKKLIAADEEKARLAMQAAAAKEPSRVSGEESTKSTSQSYSGGFMRPTTGVVTSWYGYRIDPVYGGTGFHGGIDIADDYNTPLYAAKSGVVVFADYNGSYGNVVYIEHPDGYITRYAHMNQILAYVGQNVSKGDRIGLMGSTGKSTGSHVHFEIRVGNRYDSYSIDPAPYIGY